MDRNTLTRRATLTWLEAMRLPLTAAERIATRTGRKETTSGPAAAFGLFEAKVKDTVGRLTADDTLQGLARLQRAELRERLEAAEKQLEAQATREKALAEADHREAALERQREEIELRAAQREQELEQQRAEAKRAVAAESAKKQAAQRDAAAKTQRHLDDQATRAEAERLRVEAEALKAKEQAVAAQGAVLDLDRAVKTKKAARKNG